MQYVIMDLEWNNTYAKKVSGFLNEVIEIGAVKLDDDLDNLDTFTCIIRSQSGKKLRGSVKRLTHLTNDDISTGLPFTQVFSAFRKWIGPKETVIFTWGDGDIRVLLENFRYLNGIKTIPFLQNYCDLQRVSHAVTKSPKGQQVGLSAAAASLGIDPEVYIHHRALGDSMLTAEILRKIYDPALFRSLTVPCGSEFYDRLQFKAKIIRNLDNPLVDKKRMHHVCEVCKTECEQLTEWKFHSQAFRANFFCPTCGLTYAVSVRFKKYYDHVECRKVVSVKEEPAPNETEEASV